ncbi:uncharacterized protein LOC111087854 [Limulus polyphemus]|uniref:Uncharacterized protein LOC111087854 n=1 Tax=Limulus polyphemus TaxID=6850 RepID=A0ABM1T771_LIMPO|nr:uncharacterized protein LOC111087854 [Limulus polyphemus]
MEEVIKWNNYMYSLDGTEMKDAGVHLDKILVMCSYEGDDNCQPIYKTCTTSYGNCYTINSDWRPTAVVRNLHNISKLKRGNKIHMYLYLYLDPNVSFPAGNNAVIGFSTPDSIPDMKNDMYLLKPGKMYTFSVSQEVVADSSFLGKCNTYNAASSNKTISHLLPPPYVTNCTDYDKMGRASFRGGLLTQQTCYMECVANLTFEICGCIYRDYPHLFELPGPVRLCEKSKEEGVCNTNPLISDTIDARHYCEGVCRTPCRLVLPPACPHMIQAGLWISGLWFYQVICLEDGGPGAPSGALVLHEGFQHFTSTKFVHQVP